MNIYMQIYIHVYILTYNISYFKYTGLNRESIKKRPKKYLNNC